MEKLKNNNLTMLKCSNCGSSIFDMPEEGHYKCCYCGSVLKDNDEVKKSFVKFLNSKSKTNSNIHIVNSLVSKEEFYKKAISTIALSKDSPLDVLTAKFEDVKLQYSYFIVLNAEFQVATLSNNYFSNISFLDPETNGKTISIQAKVKAEEDLVSQELTICSPVYKNYNSSQSEMVYKDLAGLIENYNVVTVSAEKLESEKISLPTKKLISERLDEIINESKAELLQASKSSHSRIMHEIHSIDLYIIPKYSLTYHYNDNLCTISSFAYETKIMGDIPNDTKSLNEEYKKKAAYLPCISITVSAITSLLALLHLKGVFPSSLFWINLLYIPIIGLSFLSCSLFYRVIVKKILKNRFMIKREKLEEFFTTTKPTNLTLSDKEFIETFEGWC